MKAKTEIRKKLQDAKEDLAHLKASRQYTRIGVVQEEIKTLEWVLQ